MFARFFSDIRRFYGNACESRGSALAPEVDSIKTNAGDNSTVHRGKRNECRFQAVATRVAAIGARGLESIVFRKVGDKPQTLTLTLHGRAHVFYVEGSAQATKTGVEL